MRQFDKYHDTERRNEYRGSGVRILQQLDDIRPGGKQAERME
jgi:hypothetical protein